MRKLRVKKATTITDMYAALDLGQRTIRAVLKRQDGKIVNIYHASVNPLQLAETIHRYQVFPSKDISIRSYPTKIKLPN